MAPSVAWWGALRCCYRVRGQIGSASGGCARCKCVGLCDPMPSPGRRIARQHNGAMTIENCIDKPQANRSREAKELTAAPQASVSEGNVWRAVAFLHSMLHCFRGSYEAPMDDHWRR